MPAEIETIYEGPAHDATFYAPSAGIARFRFNDLRASGYVRARDGALFRVEPGARLHVETGQHVLALYDPKLMARVSITFEAL